MTCRNIRSAGALTQPEIDPLKQLKWVHEVPGIDEDTYTMICDPLWEKGYFREKNSKLRLRYHANAWNVSNSMAQTPPS